MHQHDGHRAGARSRTDRAPRRHEQRDPATRPAPREPAGTPAGRAGRRADARAGASGALPRARAACKPLAMTQPQAAARARRLAPAACTNSSTASARCRPTPRSAARWPSGRLASRLAGDCSPQLATASTAWKQTAPRPRARAR
ncbi:MAG: hypothetical protein MZW92_57530 [Comamonadaceae bacterium]|nr:hypothetical protein [Comamonadaceae bacterium]